MSFPRQPGASSRVSANMRLTQISNHFNAEPQAAKQSPRARHGSYSVREEPLGAPKPIRIIGIGAGASGINMVRTLRLNLTDYEHVIYEKNEDVGGTWFENRYPGCRCDIPSHNYQFSWRPNPEWSNFFSPAEEIEAYLCQICREEKMMDVIKTSHKIIGAQWNEDKGVWQVRVANLRTGEEFDDYANFLLDASGILNNWKWPDIEGLHDYKGELIHSANWPKDFEYTNKRVAVIGNGSTGIQIVPAIQPDVQKLFHFIRTPTWVVPPRIQTMATFGASADILADVEVDEREDFTPTQIQKFKQDPEFYRKFVKAVEKDVNGNFPIVLKDSPMQEFASAQCREYMTAMLGGDERLCKALIPTFPLGCRRMTPAHGYLKSLTQSNVVVSTEGIKRFVADGIQLASGEVVKLDAIVCATGFDVSFCPRFPLIGRNGNLQDIWKDQVPKAYMSCAVPGLPNYFTFMGPNAPGGHGSIFTASEHIAKYVTGVIKKCQTEGIKAIAPLQDAVDDLYEHLETFMPRTAWASPCRSWFKAGREDGPVTALHPGSRIHFFHMLEKFRGEDFEYVYDHPRQNRFRYLGNGFSTKELDENIDSTWYLDASTVIS